MEKDCEGADGVLNLRVTLAKLQSLAKRGLLKIQCPRDEAELRRLVGRYDSKGACRLETTEWASLIGDIVSPRADWTGCALRKAIRDLMCIKQELAQTQDTLASFAARKREQRGELLRLARQRYPNGVPKGGEAAVMGALAPRGRGARPRLPAEPELPYSPVA